MAPVFHSLENIHTKFLCPSFVLITLIGCAQLEAKFVVLASKTGGIGHKKGNW